jgi:hypothetical protein
MFFVMIDLSEGTFPHLHAKNCRPDDKTGKAAAAIPNRNA